MKRDNHYENALEAWLRARRLPYIAVDEARRSVVADGTLKSLDFIVSPPGTWSWLIDVKGRRFPSGDRQKQYWRNWSTRDDLSSLAAWHRHFGPAFRPLLVFAYHVVGDQSPLPPEELFDYRAERYAFLGVPLADYSACARPLSQRWNTVTMPTALFRRHARSLGDLFRPRTMDDDGASEPVDWPGIASSQGDWQPHPASLE